MVEVAQSYEMVRNFKAFVMCCLLLFEYAYVSPENFSDLPPRQHFREKFVRLGQNPRKCWSKHDDTPPPPMLMASRRPCPCLTCFSCCTLTPPPILSPHLLVIVSSTVLQSTPLGRVLDRKFKCHSGQILKGGTFLQRRLESLPKSLRKIVMT